MNRKEICMDTFQSLPLQGLYLNISDRNIHLLHHQEKEEQRQAHAFVLEGAVTFLLEGQPLEASEGDHLTIPYSALHAVQNASDLASKVMIVEVSELESPSYFNLASPIFASDLAGAYD
jgi:glyoxylate utilization-related uncharacterized protein